jgi:hypothetical protein
MIMLDEMHNTVSKQMPVVTDYANSTKKWIDWQLNQYFSLATQTSPENSHTTYQGGQRYWWEALADHWLNTPVSEAADDIIVRFARDDHLYRSLGAIVKNPTTQLTSVRRKIRTGKPLEMDAICLRDLEQKPGKDLLEKAASVPRILSLHRTHSYSTLENRVFIYVLTALIGRAKRYLQDNYAFVHSRRVQDVNIFLKYLEKLALETSHFDCSALEPSLAILPNNCLQYDRYYKVIWTTFRRLLLIERTTQDALQYQHTLWRETGRQLLGAFLSSRLPKCRALARSCAYIKRDMQDGRWTEHSSFPGPFQWDKYLLSFIDAWDPGPGSHGDTILEKLGADQLLVAHRAGIPFKQCAIWYHHKPFEMPHDNAAVMADYAAILEKLSAGIGFVGGLIIGSAPQGRSVTFQQYNNVIYLSFPTDFSLHPESAVDGLQKALNFVLEER